MSDQKMSLDEQLTALRVNYVEHGQGHVFQFYDKGLLNNDEKLSLLRNVQTINVPYAKECFASTKVEQPVDEFAVFNQTTIVDTCDAKEQKQWYDEGLRLVSEGKVGAILMAGGQGTRLGSSDPKGMYDIGLPSHKSLFQLQAERITKLKQLAATVHGKEQVSLPWYVMTSNATHTATVDFFTKNNYFGLPKQDVFFFTQDELPAFSSDGKIVMASKHSIAMAPNGNGGIYRALNVSGALDDMKSRGVDHLHVFGVDNVLVKVCDPSFVGYSALKNLSCANKVTLRVDPKEKVGTMCLRNGMPSVVEYSEISVELSSKKGEDGQLLFNAANIANHYFTRDTLVKVANAKLPFHVAVKKIPSVNDQGEAQPIEGVKMEMFIFDAFAMCPDMRAFAVSREGEFSPVKNAPNQSLPDSPDTARVDVSRYHKMLAKKAGATFENEADNALFELSPLVSYDGEDLQHLDGQRFKLPFHLQPSSA